ncbi:type II secretion system secretin GspD [Oceaniglobus trochenteri]|uniref:type II secretion system secretin GspD n=1 Tax=Oceaniglobus trochenteri TaxID=2763260 RepID=UPI001CFF5805|nr:type II secretion system secretin GspD [Oceaniglobus trochenteri]
MPRLLFRLALCLLLALPAPAMAQDAEDDGSFVINLRDTDITVFAEQVSRITGRTLILDPGLSGNVTVVSSQELDWRGVWSLFQSTLRVRGYTAVMAGDIWQVVPQAEALASGTTQPGEGPGSQDIVTRTLELQRLSPGEAVRVLRPLVATTGYIEALTNPNAIVVTDTRENTMRILDIARTFDSREEDRAQVISFRFADAATVGQAIVQVLGEGARARLSVDPGSNLLLVRGGTEDIAEIRRLAGAMDIAPRPTADLVIATRVLRLKYADAEVVAELARNTLLGRTELTNPVAEAVGAETTEDGTFRPIRANDSPIPEVSIQASTEQNAVVVRGTARQIDEVAGLVQSLDQRRAQVLIEAAIVEVSGDVADRLGVQFGFGDAAPPGGIAATSFGNAGVSLQSVLLALGQTSARALTGGLTIGVSDQGNFGLLIQALSQSSNANLLSTPSITTMDNQAAKIVVGQNVPFRTGSFATDGNTAQPFTTIQRQDVGITMNVLPRVTSGGVVRLEIQQEISALIDAAVPGAADLITNRRVIETTVLADNGGTIVLGGLITDNETLSESKVPLLGDIPVVGNLFKSRRAGGERRTLFVFMRPTILRSPEDVKAAAAQKYRRLQGAQGEAVPGGSLLLNRNVKRLPLEINGLY